MISYIVSGRTRPDQLRSCLASLYLQANPKEIIVANTVADTATMSLEVAVARQFGAIFIKTNCQYIWDATELAVNKFAKGNFLCFPNDDSYYVPKFGEMMEGAAVTYGWDLVYCDWVHDRIGYKVKHTSPSIGNIDKSTFLLRRSCFKTFNVDYKGDHRLRDGAFVESLIAAGVKHGRLEAALVVHN